MDGSEPSTVGSSLIYKVRGRNQNNIQNKSSKEGFSFPTELVQQVIKELKSQRDLQCKVDEKIEQVSALQCKVNHTITQIQNEQNQTFWHSRYYNILIVILFIIGVALAIYSKLVSNGFG